MAASARTSCARGDTPASTRERRRSIPALARNTSGGSSCANIQVAHAMKITPGRKRMLFNYTARVIWRTYGGRGYPWHQGGGHARFPATSACRALRHIIGIEDRQSVGEG